jgi:hypothetical protein
MRSSILAVCLGLSLLQGAALGQGEVPKDGPLIEWKPAHVIKCEDRPSSLSFSRDGRLLASNDGRQARIWDTRTWKQVGGSKDDTQFVHLAQLSPDGRTLAFTRNDGKDIHLLDVKTGKMLRTLSGHSGSVSFAFSPDGKMIATTASGAPSEGVKLWDVGTGQELGRFGVPLKAVGRIAFSPYGGLLAVPTEDGAISLLDIERRQELRRLLPVNPIFRDPTRPAFSPDGRFLAAGAWRENVIIVWNVREGKAIRLLQWPQLLDPQKLAQGRPPELAKRSPGALALVFADDCRTLTVSCSDGFLRVWEVATGKMRFIVEGAAAPGGLVQAGPLLAAARYSNEIHQIDIRNLRDVLLSRRPSMPLDLERAWSDLDTLDAEVAIDRIRDLVAVPKETIADLDKRLRATDPVKPSEIEGLVRNLDDDTFDTRERATQRLAELGELAKAHLAAALRGNASKEARRRITALLAEIDGAPTGDSLRFLRAVEVLEGIGSLEARRVLARLASGEPTGWRTREAKAALVRLNSE